jgi:predicted peroxiredoxin
VHLYISNVLLLKPEIGRIFMKDEKFILYVQTSDNPERQYSPLVLAQTAKAMDLNPKIYYLGQGLRILLPGAAEKIKLGSFPSVMEMIKKTLSMNIEIDVCEASKRMFGWEKVELIPGVSARAKRFVAHAHA